MTVWRISNHITLDGRGGLRASARWHTRGRRIVYTAPNPATALLEVLVHAELDIHDLPLSFRFLEIDVPESLARETIAPSGLAENAQQAGNEWLASLRTAVLLVPCVIVPETYNVLLNPLHPECAQIAMRRVHRHPVDDRLVAGAAGS